MRRFADALLRMRKSTSDHLRRKDLGAEKVLAAVTRLMNVAYFRVGDERYARKNKTYGIATLRRKQPARRRRHHDLRIQRQVG